MDVNISPDALSRISGIMRAFSQPVRLNILLILERGAACVCHIEMLTGLRQAAISQQLSVLKKAGLIEAVREGRHVFYQLARPGIVPAIHSLAGEMGIDIASLTQGLRLPVSGCPCPKCHPDLDARLICKKPD